MKNIFLSILMVLIYFIGFGQTNRVIYINKEKPKVSNSRYVFKSIAIIYGGTIDPNNDGTVNYLNIEKFIVSKFPNKNDVGIFCIDLENQLYKDLRDRAINSKRFINAENHFLNILKLCKKLRPNVKIGFYGIPFKTLSRYNIDQSRIDKIIKISDVIFPSLYLNFSNSENKGLDKNYSHIDINLRETLKLAVKYNKLVIPFTWYMVHPYNKSWGTQILDKISYVNYIERIFTFSFEGRSINGIVYWDPMTKNYEKYKKKDHNNKFRNYSQDDIFHYYYNR
ncbi:hypothetical protein [Sphingobacterium litopenaei]|uniref:Hyaluronidase n=1 Tax=Sphingobacterium litopenaei TaxID=2763500 RepID=A0ABR7YEM5_9SPHI|nr:hypothetical protein [Sphingobacterium litopenaei]MBD1429764.1 hypothetical protein [Sphingobacterium litopenaei]